jgi:hypothetical protein
MIISVTLKIACINGQKHLLRIYKLVRKGAVGRHLKIGHGILAEELARWKGKLKPFLINTII